MSLLDECRAPGLLARDFTHLQRLGRRVKKAIAAGEVDARPVRIAIVSSFLCDIVADVLPALLLRRGLAATIALGPFGAIAGELLKPGGGVAKGADAVAILPTWRDLAHAPPPGCSREDAAAAAAREVEAVTRLWSAVAAPVVHLGFDPPPHRPLGELDGLTPGGLLFHARAVNSALAAAAPAHVSLVDAEALAQRCGADWRDPALYAVCKQPFGAGAVVEVADTLAAALAAHFGRSRKVLALDLDNTLWGGVVGDVGVEGIVVGMDSAEGEAFLAVQAFAKALAARGVILAVCSKNGEANALEPFRAHPSMLLKERDIACFVANFDDKAQNLRRIARTLNVGLDSIVFVDDNPAERAWVARELPEVLVVDLPDDPAGFCAAIEREKAFAATRLTAEDFARGEHYAARRALADAADAAGDMDAFLRDLEQTAIVEPVGPGSIERIVQLVAKTNQFKLNATTFSVQEIRENAGGVIALRFRDRMTDHGVVAVAVTEPDGDALAIRNWVMSCRVFARRLEFATLDLFRARARGLGLDRIALRFAPSSKNAPAREALDALGFVDGGDGVFTIPTNGESAAPHHIRIAALEEARG